MSVYWSRINRTGHGEPDLALYFATADLLADRDAGDITISGSGLTWTIDAGAVTLAKMADVATSTVFYRKTAGTGVPEVQTLATLKTDLDLTGTNSGDQTITLTGDVTGSGTGSFAATIVNDAVTYAKMQDASAGNVVLARSDAASGDYGEVSLALSQLLGRGSAGNIAAITLGTNLSMSGDTLNASGGSASLSSTSIAFTDGDTARRVTVTDAAVTALSKIVCTIRRPDSTDDSADAGYVYIANVVKIAAGSFDVFVACLDTSGGDPTLQPPNETVVLTYTIG